MEGGSFSFSFLFSHLTKVRNVHKMPHLSLPYYIETRWKENRNPFPGVPESREEKGKIISLEAQLALTVARLRQKRK